MAADFGSVEQRIDDLTLPLLGPLRSMKVLDGEVFADLLRAGDDLAEAMSDQDTAPVALVGKAWFIFTAMLNEADHARAPEPILDAAWQWEEKLRLAFGPKF